MAEVKIVIQRKRLPDGPQAATDPYFDVFNSGEFNVADDQLAQLTKEVSDIRKDFEVAS